MIVSVARPLLAAILLALACAAQANAISEWDQMYRDGGAHGRIALRVIDDMGMPVDDAEVEAYFNANPSGVSRRVRTGVDGRVEVEGKSTYDVRFTVEKTGYYRSSVRYYFAAHAPSQDEAIHSGRWMPWNAPFTMTLKKIRNPVAMYAREIHGFPIPCNQPIGFDLEIGDAVVPHGKGVQSDLVFNVDRHGRAWSISVANAHDGLQRLEMDTWSKFRTLYEAPVDGYLNIYESRDSSVEPARRGPGPGKEYYFVFRVRSETNGHGRLTRAKYGKMWDRVDVGGDYKNTCNIAFGYWFNPDGTRNLEFDPKKNVSSRRWPWEDGIAQP